VEQVQQRLATEAWRVEDSDPGAAWEPSPEADFALRCRDDQSVLERRLRGIDLPGGSDYNQERVRL
jgi:hypothetical protein